jgi:tRNA dimethylallyltransferase
MKYIIICGPTCSGKTSLGINLARKYDGEIIGADSRQIYKHIDIGTAKPRPEEYPGLKYHLIDFLELNEDFSAFKYAELAQKLIIDALNRGKVAIVVGGTGLYLKALTEGLFHSPEPDYEYRKELENFIKANGVACLHAQLELVDPEAAARIKTGDRQRIIRALEAYKLTGKPISELQKTGEYNKMGQPLWIGLDIPRDILYHNINRRVDTMITDGWERELLSLDKQIEHLRRKKVVGYEDMIACVYDNKLTLDEAIEKIKQHHRNYAKRQMTWFRGVKEINWFNPLENRFLDKVFGICDEYFKSA